MNDLADHASAHKSTELRGISPDQKSAADPLPRSDSAARAVSARAASTPIAIADIVVAPERMRKLRPDVVNSIAKSIKEQDLSNK